MCVHMQGKDREGERDFKLIGIFNSYLVKSVGLLSHLCGYRYVSKCMSVSVFV